MKKLINIFTIMAVIGLFHAQTNTENYIQSKTYLEPVTNSSSTAKKIEIVQYLDYLGRPKQVVNVKATPLGRDLVTPILYDEKGRQTRDYFPVPQPATSAGAIYSQTSGLDPFPVPNASTFYNGEKIYSEKVFENSSLGKVLEQKQPGNAWNDKSVKWDYDFNLSNEVRKYATTTTWEENRTHSDLRISVDTASVNGFYKLNQLQKNIMTDEDGNKTIEFKDPQGHTVLVRKLNGSESIDTYYIYNEYGQIAYVLSPKAAEAFKNLIPGTKITDTILNELSYQYRYDGKNRLVEKKIPGKGWEYLVYDKADRLILTQDTEMKKTGKWIITKYDKFGRIVYTGIIAGGDRINMQLQAGDYEITESRDNTGFNLNGMQIYYTNNFFQNIETALQVHYYDKYPILPSGVSIPAYIFGQQVLLQPGQEGKSTMSLPVSSYVKNIENDNWTKNFIFYDIKGRTIGTNSLNHLGGYTKTELELDFTGGAKQSRTYHKRLNSDTEKLITQTFEYDDQNKLKKQWHKIDAGAEELISENTYNEISQLSNKKVGNNLQSIDYHYNIRGWITGLNDPANLNGKLFGYSMKYTDPEFSTIANGKFNGNVTEIDWKSAQDGVFRRYNYRYDTINRLLEGAYAEPFATVINNDYFTEKMSYDLNGNITTLKRYTRPSDGLTALEIDDLVYNYQNGDMSNKLNQITVPSGKQNNIQGYNALGGILGYDDNGNIIVHQDKGINKIDYNILNLPSKIFVLPGTKKSSITQYIYRADGAKLTKSFTSQETTTVTDYLDGFQYMTNTAGISGPELKFVPTSEGYFDFIKNKYIYNYTDHLGNIRVSYFNNDSGAEILEENNYYPFGLKHAGYNILNGNPNYQYMYNGKERQETGMYDYGARFYMPELGRWGVIDPLAEASRRFTPYNYANSNPIRFVDPDGRFSVTYTGAAAQQIFLELRANIDSRDMMGDPPTGFTIETLKDPKMEELGKKNDIGYLMLQIFGSMNGNVPDQLIKSEDIERNIAVVMSKKTTSYSYYDNYGKQINRIEYKRLMGSRSKPYIIKTNKNESYIVNLNHTPKSENLEDEKYKVEHRLLTETSIIRQGYSDYISLENSKNIITSQSVKVKEFESVDLFDRNVNQSLLLEVQKAQTFNYNQIQNQIDKAHDIIIQSMEGTSKFGD